jgi:putative tricarboxylic transport membrane protein
MGIVRNGQALFALFLLILNAGYLAEALTLPRPFQFGEPGPAFLPIVLSCILFLAAGCILFEEIRGTGVAEAEGAPVGRVSARPILLAGITAGFVYLFEPLGYWVATLLYSFAVAALFEYEKTSGPLRTLAVSAAIAVGMTVIGWLFFVTLFDLFLPTGDW